MSVLIITGDANKYGSGHNTRMHTVALELKKHKITVQHLTIDTETRVSVPLPYMLAILDRRDTAFNPPVLETAKYAIAVDNRGPGREAASLALDLLPHHEMNKLDYETALSHVIISPALTDKPCSSQAAKITLHDSKENAFAAADFYLQGDRLAPAEFSLRLSHSRRPACYFGQTLFEAIYLGLDVQLYPVSEYHKKLAVDLFSRQLIDPNLLARVDGLGLKRFCETIQKTLKAIA